MPPVFLRGRYLLCQDFFHANDAFGQHSAHFMGKVTVDRVTMRQELPYLSDRFDRYDLRNFTSNELFNSFLQCHL